LQCRGTSRSSTPLPGKSLSSRPARVGCPMPTAPGQAGAPCVQ
jgi:hypothetical protein